MSAPVKIPSAETRVYSMIFRIKEYPFTRMCLKRRSFGVVLFPLFPLADGRFPSGVTQRYDSKWYHVHDGLPTRLVHAMNSLAKRRSVSSWGASKKLITSSWTPVA